MATSQGGSDRPTVLLAYWRMLDRGWKATIIGLFLSLLMINLYVPW